VVGAFLSLLPASLPVASKAWDGFEVVYNEDSVGEFGFRGDILFFSHTPTGVDIPHQEEKKGPFCGNFSLLLNSPTLS
jgi:hypothetical protein